MEGEPTEFWEVNSWKISIFSFSDLDFRGGPLANRGHGRYTTKGKITIHIFPRNAVAAVRLSLMKWRHAATMTPGRSIQGQAEKWRDTILLPHRCENWVVRYLVVAKIVVRKIGAGEGKSDIRIC